MREKTLEKVAEISAWLGDVIDRSEPGERLPTVRQIMRKFGTAQRTVETAFRPFLAEGRLRSRPGSGIIVCDLAESSAGSQWDGDLLVLYRISDSRLARTLLQELDQRFKTDGIGVLQIGYSSEEQALSVLQRLGRFKTCLIQIHFQVVSIDFLAELKRRVGSIVIDGVSATGIDVDSVGTNWREAVALAHRKLAQFGHQRIGFLTSSHNARQIAMTRREFEFLTQEESGGPRNSIASRLGWLIEVDRLPGDYRTSDIVDALKPLLQPDGTLPFSALIVWGTVEGYILENALTALGSRAYRNLSVVLLGSTDFVSEHLSRFDVVGNSNAGKIDFFDTLLRHRIAFGDRPPATHYLPISYVRYGSITEP